MSLHYTDSGYIALCDNGYVAETDDCPCCGDEVFSAIEYGGIFKKAAIPNPLASNTLVNWCSVEAFSNAPYGHYYGFNGSYFLAVTFPNCGHQHIYKSTNGVDWELVAESDEYHCWDFGSLKWYDDRWVIEHYDNHGSWTTIYPYITSSTDGIIWTISEEAGGFTMSYGSELSYHDIDNSFRYLFGYWSTVNETWTNYSRSTTDYETWFDSAFTVSNIPSDVLSEYNTWGVRIWKMIKVNGTYYGIGYYRTGNYPVTTAQYPLLATSTDGLNWTDTDLSVRRAGYPIRDIAWNGSMFLLFVNSRLYTSPDGLNWTSRVSSFGSAYAAIWMDWNSEAECWVAIDPSNYRFYLSVDGINWTIHDSASRPVFMLNTPYSHPPLVDSREQE